MQATATSPSLERQGTHALFTTGISVALGLALSVLVARTLGPAGKGILDVTGATAALFTLVLGGSLNAGLTHLIARHGAIPRGLTLQLALWSAGAAALVTVGLVVRPALAARFGLLPTGDHRFWISFIVVSVAFGIWGAGLRGIVIGRHALITANRIDVSIKTALLLAYVALAVALVPDPKFFALAGAGAAVVLPLALIVALRGPRASVPGLWPALLATALPVHSTNILHFINQRADVFFVQAFHGATEVGLYTLAVSLAQIVLLVSSALTQPLLPQVSAAASPAAAAAAASRTCRMFVAIGLIAGVLLAAGAKWLVPLVFGRDFSGSLPSLLVLLPGMIAFGLTNVLISYFVGIGRSTTNLWISLATLVVTVAGNFWLTRRYGALGAAATSTLAYGLAGALSLLAFARHSGGSALAAVCPTRADWHDTATIVSRFRL